MAATSMPHHGVMEGKGAYNRYAKLQASGVAAALPFLEEAAQGLDLGCDEPLVIADYGSSQGKNSLAPIRVAIEKLCERAGSNRPILVFHIDQPGNDFNTLIDVLNTDVDSYSLNEANVFPCAIGRSFYEKVLPEGSVHLGWCSYAAVWLSWIPARITGHFMPIRATGPERLTFQNQAAQDWRVFLSLRAAELRNEGRLIVVLPAQNDDGTTGLEDFMDHANAVLTDMVKAEEIHAEERERMVIGSYPRRRCDLLAPFNADGEFDDFVVECCELAAVPDFAWAQYERDLDEEALAAKHARFFRATFAPSLANALANAENGADRVFAERLESRLQRRLARCPAPLHSYVQVMVLRKRGQA